MIKENYLEFLFAGFKCSQHPTSHLSFRKFTPSWQVMETPLFALVTGFMVLFPSFKNGELF